MCACDDNQWAFALLVVVRRVQFVECHVTLSCACILFVVVSAVVVGSWLSRFSILASKLLLLY